MKNTITYSILILTFCVMLIGSCKSTKNLSRGKSITDSVGKSEFIATKETNTKETIDKEVTVDGSEIFGWWNTNDTLEQTIESEDLVVKTKVNYKTGKATLTAKSKPKTIKVQGTKETNTKEAVSDKKEAAVEKKVVTKEKQKETKSQAGTFITIAVVVALILLFLFLWLRRKR